MGVDTPSADGARRLRVGLLVDSPVQPAWVRRAVEQIQTSDVARVALVVHGSAPADRGPVGGRLRRWYRGSDRVLYRLYTRVDRAWFRARPDAFELADLAPLVAGVPVITLVPPSRSGEPLSDGDVDRIREHHLDVALCFGFGVLRGRALTLARHGVWAYHHGDDRTRPGGPAGFWEVMTGDPVTGAVLHVLADQPGGGQVLYRSYGHTHPLSVSLNRHQYYWKSSTFALRRLRDLHREGAAALAEPDGEPPAPPASCARLSTPPRNGEMAVLLGRLAVRYARAKLHERTRRLPWSLAYQLRPGPPSPDDSVPDLVLHRFRLLAPPAGRFWADPFAAYVGGRHYILFEDGNEATARGHIAAIALDRDGRPSAPVPVLVRDHHLSYPFLFTWRGEHYMIPESTALRRVDLYRATRFPYEWQHERILIAGEALADVTLQEIEGRWWMFATAPAVPEVRHESWLWEELHVFHAESPLGPWTPHPRNPVVSDVRRARPAGRLFRYRGEWYRPGQDSGTAYGAGLALQRITRLDTERYAEVAVTTLRGDWRPGLVGLHTVNAAGGLTVVDLRLRRWRRPFAPRSRAQPVARPDRTDFPAGGPLPGSTVAIERRR
jgi:hypothetical protein